jgi:hypothetical protein
MSAPPACRRDQTVRACACKCPCALSLSLSLSLAWVLEQNARRRSMRAGCTRLCVRSQTSMQRVLPVYPPFRAFRYLPTCGPNTTHQPTLALRVHIAHRLAARLGTVLHSRMIAARPLRPLKGTGTEDIRVLRQHSLYHRRSSSNAASSISASSTPPRAMPSRLPAAYPSGCCIRARACRRGRSACRW